MKYTANQHLLGAFTADGGERRVINPGDIVTARELYEAGFKDIDLLLNAKPNFTPALSVVRGTENDPSDLPSSASPEDRIRELQGELDRLQAEKDAQGAELESLKVAELKERAESLGVEGFASLNKADLISAISAKQSEQGQ